MELLRLNEFLSLLLFPAALNVIAGPEEAKNLSGGNALRLIQIHFDDGRVCVVRL